MVYMLPSTSKFADGSAGSTAFPLCEKLNIDVKLIGLGEKMDDLQEFDLDAYIYGLTKGLMENNEK